MTKATPAVKTQMVPIDRIDEPSIIMREEMSDEGLESLGRSLKELGQLQAIGVVVEGNRYRVIWGHRRRLAAGRAGLTHLECKVFPAGTTDVEARKAHENFEQEPLNVVAEATYYEQLFEKVCNHDVDQVAALVHKPLSRVLDRMDLLRWPENVRQALREGRISMAVGKILNQCKDDGYRNLFLADAIRDGATSRTVQTWVDEVKRTLRYQEAAKEAGVGTDAPVGVASYTSMDACAICGSEGDQHEMEYRKIHASCYRVLVRQRDQPGPTEPTR